jgi:hypothetical protein
MKTKTNFLLFLLGIYLFTGSTCKLYCQQDIDWLIPYTSEISAGSYSYKYSFSKVESKECKIKVEENKTDKKANSVVKSYVFYLSDLDPSTFTFKTSGSNVIVTLGTKSAQKFISTYVNNTLDEYIGSLVFYLDAIDKARSFIDVVKSHCNDCKASDMAWTSTSEAFDWLSKNIGESSNSGSLIKQQFFKGEKNFLARLSIETTDSKGTISMVNTFDLSDIDSKGIALKVTGKILKIEVLIKGGEYFIQSKKDQNISFQKDLDIYADDIEIARNIVNALNYLVGNVKSERKDWNNYTAALTFVKDNLKEVTIGTNKVAQSINFSESPSGIVSFIDQETDSKGSVTEETNAFYLNDLSPEIKIEASSKNVYLAIGTKDKNKYIKQLSGNKTTGYVNSFKIYIDDIDKGRDLSTALEYAIKNSTSGVQEFANMSQAVEWLSGNSEDVTIDNKSYHQTIQFNTSNENQIDLNIITSDVAGTSTNDRFEIYPEDLSKDEMKIKISGKKLSVPLSTGKSKYIKAFLGDAQQNFTDETEMFFEDIQKAKSFIAALQYIQEKSIVSDRTMSNSETAFTFLKEHITAIEIAGNKREQKLEPQESGECKLKYTMSQTDSKGVSTEYAYDFILSDIDPAKSAIAVSGKELHVNLVTLNKQKLIKPYKNGEAGAFIYDFDIISGDVLEAKKILGAFLTVKNGCK